MEVLEPSFTLNLNYSELSGRTETDIRQYENWLG